ncbi:hypothetical protein GCM10023329_44420 [Streptomyces sanyensis]|uniref:Secreted protein n=1 Tax=Streptomyces sanyensis TaxID=568869 RepID=A0ABP9AZ43_9ACTN
MAAVAVVAEGSGAAWAGATAAPVTARAVRAIEASAVFRRMAEVLSVGMRRGLGRAWGRLRPPGGHLGPRPEQAGAPGEVTRSGGSSPWSRCGRTSRGTPS